ncbi:uncharacterized protein IUM83_01225 [Phytophthora cinnamomi]|uniref:uncharacterized protein n=1 Tax=Phytophthora cinnamomi TaxID=4785 RepID=UPI00355A0225|nr:hypothetical protein IUM83_01225 [Phytophthora cinnamomi]
MMDTDLALLAAPELKETVQLFALGGGRLQARVLFGVSQGGPVQWIHLSCTMMADDSKEQMDVPEDGTAVVMGT